MYLSFVAVFSTTQKGMYWANFSAEWYSLRNFAGLNFEPSKDVHNYVQMYLPQNWGEQDVSDFGRM